MKVRTIVTEDYTNYKLPSMFVGCIYCDGKCCREGNFPLSTCINNEWMDTNVIEISDDELISLYLSNPITSAIVFGLLEPMLQADDIRQFVRKLRVNYHCNDIVVIYTGYTENEVSALTSAITALGNVIIKYGRFTPNCESHYDEVLGVNLASPNQYAKYYK